MSYDVPTNLTYSTLKTAYVHGTSIRFEADSVSDFPSSGYVYLEHDGERVLQKYSTRNAANDWLESLSDAADVTASSGASGHTFPVGTTVVLAWSVDYLTQLLSANGLQVEDFLNLPAATELTIATGVVTATQSSHTIDTEGDAASDDLDTISGGAAGRFLILRAANDARTVVLKHGTGNIITSSGSDISLDSDDKVVILYHDGTNWIVVWGPGAMSSATTSARGAVELATVAETNTGTDAVRTVTPDGLAGSIHGTKVVEISDLANDTAVALADDWHWFVVPASLAGMDLVAVGANVRTVSSSGTVDVQIHNLTDAVDMLSTKITIDATEHDSKDAATPAAIDGANDDVAEGDIIRIDVDAAGTGALGLSVRLEFRKP